MPIYPSASSEEPTKKIPLFIILSAGKATRFFDFSQNYAKSILPHNGVPLIVHNMRNIYSAYPDAEIWVTVPENNTLSESIENAITLYWGMEHFQNHKVMFVKQPPKGPGHSIIDVVTEIGDRRDIDNATVILGDIALNEWNRWEEVHSAQQEKTLTMTVAMVNDWSRWCIVKGGTFYDKPIDRPHNGQLFALNGVYSFSDYKHLYDTLIEFNIIENNDQDEIQILEVLNLYKQDGDVETVTILTDSDREILDFGDITDWKKNNRVSTSRSFNVISDDGMTIVKKSENPQKILDEHTWMSVLGSDGTLHRYVPRVFQFDIDGKCFAMEKIKHPTLRDIFLFLDRSEETWRKIFERVFEFLDVTEIEDNESSFEFWKSIPSKTESRFKSIKLNPSVLNIFLDEDRKVVSEFIDVLNENIANTKPISSIMHGDLCFSNIFYGDDSIKLVDPNGRIYGCKEYELAKLMHSAVYFYDFIDSNLYLNFDRNYNGVLHFTKNCEKIGKIFVDMMRERGYNIHLIRLITASLFLSMIPLHSHSPENQAVYFETFKKVFREWKSESSLST